MKIKKYLLYLDPKIGAVGRIISMAILPAGALFKFNPIAKKFSKLKI